ncbi:NUDIX domain-containing protein [Amniculicola lignicola CBS 123094]|uniref:NUDIX domain-containing protein n=1 Tax=Amniculicola lignicola CBS 123094 TaxID=1392246 RepID=A0A6A5WLJ7_9PLEO|nr:NUDIX domain-containing protein [Amniculicola lignicola CBS 123094]
MAQSTFVQHQFSSEFFVESCGAVLFDLSGTEKKVCLLHYVKYNQWLLAKGRRNHSESRKDAALREVMEETGYRCHLLPVAMPTRTTPPDGPARISDSVRIYPDLTDPFMFTMRYLGDGLGVKLIWWYLAALDEDAESNRLPGEAEFEPSFLPFSEAIERLTYQSDREVVGRAVELVKDCGTKNS